MTEVHALDEQEENGEDGDDSNGEKAEGGSTKISAGECTGGIRDDSASGINERAMEKKSDKLEDISLSAAKASKSSMVKDKKKDAKKKSLKRL